MPSCDKLEIVVSPPPTFATEAAGVKEIRLFYEEIAPVLGCVRDENISCPVYEIHVLKHLIQR